MTHIAASPWGGIAHLKYFALKISKELKVGTLALCATALLIWGFNYLKGRNLFSNNKTIYAVYDNVDGLSKSSTVKISGLNVGLVTDINLLPDNSGRVLVTMEVSSKIAVPRNTIPELVDISMLGGKAIVLNFKGECLGDDCISNGDTLYGTSMGMFEGLTKEIDPYIAQVKKTFNAIDSMLRSMSTDGDGESLDLAKTLRDFQGTLANLNATTARLNAITAASSGDIQQTLANLNSVSATLKNSQADIQKIVGNVSAFSDRLEAIELEETVDSTQMTFAAINNSLRTLDGAIEAVETLITAINEGDGTLSQLIESDALMLKVDQVIESVNLLTDDIRLNPKRYINLRRKSKPYEVLEDPAEQQ